MVESCRRVLNGSWVCMCLPGLPRALSVYPETRGQRGAAHGARDQPAAGSGPTLVELPGTLRLIRERLPLSLCCRSVSGCAEPWGL